MLVVEYTHSHQSQDILFHGHGPLTLRLAARPGVVQESAGLDDRPLALLHVTLDRSFQSLMLQSSKVRT
jgi:hypothetical protein